MTAAERRAFNERAAERELYKAKSMWMMQVFFVYPPKLALNEPMYPGQIIQTEVYPVHRITP